MLLDDENAMPLLGDPASGGRLGCLLEPALCRVGLNRLPVMGAGPRARSCGSFCFFRSTSRKRSPFFSIRLSASAEVMRSLADAPRRTAASTSAQVRGKETVGCFSARRE
jgi:hypothetical protein